MYDITQAICSDAGFVAYEVSNHAKPGQESRHNLIYWESGDYVGIGPGAHGRVTENGVRYATEAPRAPGAWLEAVSNGTGETTKDAISSRDQVAEFVLMGLRTREGLARDRMKHLEFDFLYNNINYLVEIDMLEKSETHLRATATGRRVLNAVLERLLRV